MSKRIITISREFGSGGRYLGKEIAEKLGIAFYDKEIIEKAAKESGLSEEYIEKNGEYSPTKHSFAYAFVGRNSSGLSLEDYIYSVQRKIILEIAEKESCVIVGRCADFILRERDDGIHAFICGNQEKKAERIQELYSLTKAEAVKRMKDMDKKRSLHYEYYTEQKWGMAKNYSICLNSSEIGYENCIQIITEMVQKNA